MVVVDESETRKRRVLGNGEILFPRACALTFRIAHCAFRIDSDREIRNAKCEMRNNYHLGLDLGGTKFSALLLDARGKELAFREVPVRKTWTPRQLRAMLQSLAHDAVMRAKVKPRRVRAVGIGVPGVTDERGGVLKAVNLPALEHTKLTGLLPRARTEVRNDVVCAAYAETKKGALSRSKRGVLLMLGTGVGGAVVTRTHPPFGRRGGLRIEHVEIGHAAANILAAVPDRSRREPYEIEEYCSRKFFRRNGAEKLYAAFRNGDGNAASLFARYGANVGALLASAETLFWPDTIVLGGGMTAYLPAYRRAMKTVFRERRFMPGKSAIIKISSFGPEAGALGAALMSGEK
jgi:glucokinase